MSKLTDEQIFDLRQSGKSYKEISKIDGRSVSCLTSRYFRFCQSKGIDINQTNARICKKIEKKTEAQAESIAESIVKQRKQSMQASALIVQKLLEILVGGGEYFGEGSANLNLLANVLSKVDTFLMNRESANPTQESMKPDNLDAIADGYGLKDYQR